MPPSAVIAVRSQALTRACAASMRHRRRPREHRARAQIEDLRWLLLHTAGRCVRPALNAPKKHRLRCIKSHDASVRQAFEHARSTRDGWYMKHMEASATRATPSQRRNKAWHERTDAAHLRYTTMTSISAPQHCSRRRLTMQVVRPEQRAGQTMSTHRRGMLARSHMVSIDLLGTRDAQWPPSDRAHEQQKQVGSLAAAPDGTEWHMQAHLRWHIEASTQRHGAHKAPLESALRARSACPAPGAHRCRPGAVRRPWIRDGNISSPGNITLCSDTSRNSYQ